MIIGLTPTIEGWVVVVGAAVGVVLSGGIGTPLSESGAIFTGVGLAGSVVVGLDCVGSNPKLSILS